MYARVAGTGRRIAPILLGSIAVVIFLGCAGGGDLTAPDQVVVKKGPTANFLYCNLTVTADRFPSWFSTITVAPSTDFDVVYTLTNNDVDDTCNNSAYPYVASGTSVILNGNGGAGSISIPPNHGDGNNFITFTAHYHAGSTRGNSVVNINAAGFSLNNKRGGGTVVVDTLP